MVNSEILRLFPTAVGIYDLNRKLSKKEISFFRQLDYKPNMGNTTSVNTVVCNDKALEKLTEFFNKSLKHYCRFTFDFSTDIEIYITQSWTNRTTQNQYHHRHSHQNSLISGVFYISSDEDDKIQFINDDRLSNGRFDFQTYGINDFNCRNYWLPTPECRLILFPSPLEHEVTIKEGEKLRESLAFNTFMRGKIGSTEELTELTLL